MLQMATQNINEVEDRMTVVRRAVIQCVADIGLSPVSVPGKKSMMVRYRQPSRMKSLKPVYVIVAELKISSSEDGDCLVRVRPKLYGHDRPKVEDLITCLQAKKVDGVNLKVVVES